MNTDTHPAYDAARGLGRSAYLAGQSIEAAIADALAFVGEAAETEPVRTEVVAGANTGWRLAQLGA
jgi:hypothetical protein